MTAPGIEPGPPLWETLPAILSRSAGILKEASTASFLRLSGFLLCTNHWHYAKKRNVAGSIPEQVIGFFDSPNSSSRTMALGSTQPPAEMSTRNLPGGGGGKGRPARKADNVSTIYELTV
jgi:hypothetical protein